MKKNTGLILLYLGIFFGVTMALQAAAGKETYESEKIKIGVVDKDNGPLAEGLVKWLEGTHHVTMLEDNREKLQEELFYRNVEYIVVIPEDFYENCMVNGESISVTKVRILLGILCGSATGELPEYNADISESRFFPEGSGNSDPG